MDRDVLQLILSAGWITKVVLAVLMGFSVLTWAVIIHKWKAMRRIVAADRAFMAAYTQAKTLEDLARRPNLSLDLGVGRVFFDGMEKIRSRGSAAFSTEWLGGFERRLKGSVREEASKQEQYLAILATTANAAPFIGLFGTVWGIINAFQDIASQGSASIAAVAPGVAEALVATAAGLFAAIPAVVAFNHFINQVRAHAAQMESFAVDFTDLLHETGSRGTSA